MSRLARLVVAVTMALSAPWLTALPAHAEAGDHNCSAPELDPTKGTTVQVCIDKSGAPVVRIVHTGQGGTTKPGPPGKPACTTDCPPAYVVYSSCDNVAPANYDTCTGAITGICPAGQAMFTAYVETATQRFFIAQYCRDPAQPPPPPPPPPWVLVQEYIKAFPPAQAIGSRQPEVGTPLPVTLDLFVRATKPDQVGGTVGRNGMNVTVHFTDVRYTWDFGDGSPPLVTSDTGGTYPGGTLRHPYARARDYTATLTVEWFVTYDFTFGATTVNRRPYGWVAQPGPAQAFPVHVVEAHAVLTH